MIGDAPIPCAAPKRWPFLDHRTVAELTAARGANWCAQCDQTVADAAARACQFRFCSLRQHEERNAA